MLVEAKVTVPASRGATWAAISDIEHAAEVLSGVEQIELLERPSSGLLGLRWRETRMYFGKPASIEKWVTEVVDGTSYTTRAESPGFVYLTRLAITEQAGGMLVTSAHETRAEGLGPRLMTIPMRLFFKGVIRKAILTDLEEIKAAVAAGRYG